MLNYVVRRLLILVPMLLAVSVAVFLVLYSIPGDPARMAAGPDASEEDVVQIRANFGLDRPIHEQYAIYLGNLVQGDLGTSFRTRRPVLDEIRRTLPATVELAAAAMAIALLLGVPIGILSALRPGSWLDNTITAFAVFGISMPGFFLGLILMVIFSATLYWLPPTGRGTWAHLVMPAVTLGLPYVATYARLTRSNMLDVLSEDYIRTARAKGLARSTVIYRHALVNAAIPLVTVLGIYFGRLLGGAVIVETIFAWPGLGRIMIEAIVQRDIYVVQGTILVFAVSVVLVNLAVDVLYGVLDPRITYG
ncbi:nickel ABC transporter permease [Stella sp.]|uniref:nickel ABC transporter permease n=1 Tax=Stella sp. TaxID=2912054 RepID=UPI0035B1D0FE